MQIAAHLPVNFSVVRVPGINHLTFSADGDVLAASDTALNVKVERGGYPIFQTSFATDQDKIRPTQRVRSIKISDDGKTLYAAACDRVAAIDLASGEECWSYVAPRSFGFLIVSPLDVAYIGGRVAACFDNGSLAAWNEQGALQALWHDNDAPRNIHFLPGGDRLVGSDSFSVGVWNVSTRKRELRIRQQDRVYGIAAASKEAVGATRTLYQVQLWDLDTGSAISHFPVGMGLPLLEFHPTEPLIAVADKRSVNVVDFRGRFVHRFECGAASVLSLAWHPSGRELFVGGSDTAVHRFTL